MYAWRKYVYLYHCYQGVGRKKMFGSTRTNTAPHRAWSHRQFLAPNTTLHATQHYATPHHTQAQYHTTPHTTPHHSTPKHNTTRTRHQRLIYYIPYKLFCDNIQCDSMMRNINDIAYLIKRNLCSWCNLKVREEERSVYRLRGIYILQLNRRTLG